jgi:phage terminase small subunit
VTKKRAPNHLKPGTRRWWRDVLETWELEAHHLMLLTLAATAWDRAVEARAQIKAHGLGSPTAAGGMKLSPFVRVEESAMLTFARLLRELDLDVAPPAEARRPPMLQSLRRGRGAA